MRQSLILIKSKYKKGDHTDEKSDLKLLNHVIGFEVDQGWSDRVRDAPVINV